MRCTWPCVSTTSTPSSDSAEPSSAWRVMAALKNRRPMISIQTGMLAATSVTLIGVEVCSARYCSEL